MLGFSFGLNCKCREQMSAGWFLYIEVTANFTTAKLLAGTSDYGGFVFYEKYPFVFTTPKLVVAAVSAHHPNPI